jgi:hypothetical protein
VPALSQHLAAISRAASRKSAGSITATRTKPTPSRSSRLLSAGKEQHDRYDPVRDLDLRGSRWHRARHHPDHRYAASRSSGERCRRSEPRPWRARDLGSLTSTTEHDKGRTPRKRPSLLRLRVALS